MYNAFICLLEICHESITWLVLRVKKMANQKGCFGYTRDLSGLYDAIVSLSKEYLLKYEKRDSKVIEYRTPNEINQLIDFTLPEEGISDEEIIEQCKSVLEYSVHTGV